MDASTHPARPVRARQARSVPPAPSPVAVVAGGSAGVGRAVARALAGRGHGVAVLARDPARLAETEAELVGMGLTALALEVDMGDAAAVEAAADQVAERLGPIVVWVNSTMATSFSWFKDVPAEDFDRILRTTLSGTVNGCRAALRQMRASGSGQIVCVGSGLAYRAVPLQSAYCAAKHGINGLVGALRSELIHRGSPIQQSLVQLPAINTPQFDWARNTLAHRPQPASPIHQPEVAAAAVLRALDRRAREVLVAGSVLRLVLPTLAAPGMMDRMMARAAVAPQTTDEPDPGLRPHNLHRPLGHGGGGAGALWRARPRPCADGRWRSRVPLPWPRWW